MGKKLGLGFLGLLVVGAIYYFTAGSVRIAEEIKKQVNTELLQASTQGFKIEERKIEEKKEHFVLSFDNPEEMTHFFNTQGLEVQQVDIENLKGLTLGVDIAYLADAYSAMSIDMYPLTLPDVLTSATLASEDKNIITQISTLLKKKTLLVHLDVNKLGTGFKGYVKDINASIEDNVMTQISLQGLTFEGSLKEKKLHDMTQNLKEMKLLLDEKVTITLEGLQSNYLGTGLTNYDYETSYVIDMIQVQDVDTDTLSIKNTKISSTSNVQDNLMTASMQGHSKSIYFKNKKDALNLDDVVINTNASNIDISAFEKLQTIDPSNTKVMTTVLQEIISKGVKLDIPNISVQNILYNHKKLDDFNMTAHLDIDKSLDIATIQRNPLAALSGINAQLKLALSPALFGLISQQPKAMLMMMLFQPKDVNGKKVYGVEIKEGKILVNGTPVM